MNENCDENEVQAGSDNNSENGEENDNVEGDVDMSISSISDAEDEGGDEAWKMLASAAQPEEEAPDAQGGTSCSFAKGGGRPKNAPDKKGVDANKVIPVVKKKKDEGGGSGMLGQIKSILSPLVKRDDGTPEIVDSFVLRMHYSFGVSVFVLAFSIVQANWFTKEAVHCVFGFNADRTVTPAIKNTCLSYPYTCKPPRETVYDGEDCPRQYLMFYRWIHFSFLALAGIYYLPRIVAKKTSHSPLKKLLSHLISMEKRYDDSAFENGVSKMVTYFENHFSVHGSLYTRLLMCHVIAVVIDVGSFIYLDFFMQENFIGLIYNSYPFQRNPGNFSDNLYQPDTVLTLPSDSLLPDLHYQNGSRTQGHTSSTPKPKSRLLPPFFKSEKHADLYPIIEITP
ncbi:putative innexin inx2-like [Penaeus vannamei]|uniref:Innexin n=1 Tax=Penaeus vannamei TaxID=6689 RepID=A0A3R7NUI3_PENVA|nr:putative innexin inx2-like [Penaeus vannamei]